MKSKLFLYTIISLISCGVAYAYIDCRETTNGCTIQQLVNIGDSAPTNKEDRISAYKDAIAKINVKIKELETSQTVSVPKQESCLDIKNNLVLGSSDKMTNGEVTKLQHFLGEYKVHKLYTTAPKNQSGASAEDLQPVTGYYGAKTAQNVTEWQIDHGMNFVTQTSGVGQATRGKMKCQTPVGTTVKWDIGAKIDENFNDAVVTLNFPSGDVKTAHVSVRRDCKELNQETLNDPRFKNANSASAIEKATSSLKPGLACIDYDVFAWYAVFFENGKYSIKELNEDMSGQGKVNWVTLKEI